MNVFDLRNRVLDDYHRYVESFLNIRDRRIRDFVDAELRRGVLWPDALVQLNPSYEMGRTVSQLVADGTLHPLCERIFQKEGKPFKLYHHQEQAVLTAARKEPYILTTGTGSGKSLTYLIPIVDHVLKHNPEPEQVRALIVYPMNALINSQAQEIQRLLGNLGAGQSHIRFGRYTGQEDASERNRLQQHPPHILLTNYVMLELMMSRPAEWVFLDRTLSNLEFLVLDELHTYTGRQGADVSMLVRRVRQRSGNDRLLCVGTSATMMAGGTCDEQREAVARVASKIFGVSVSPGNVIDERLKRSIPCDGDVTDQALREGLKAGTPQDYATFTKSPLSVWIEETFGIQREGETLRRRRPIPLAGGAEQLAGRTGEDRARCEDAIRRMLHRGSELKHPDGTPVFAVRLHQFISQGDSVYATLEPTPDRLLTLTGQRYVQGEGDSDRLLVPLVFCRVCGQEYYQVTRRQTDLFLEPRLPQDVNDPQDDALSDGYLLIDDEKDPVWSKDREEDLPENWFRPTRSGRSLKAEYREFLPEQGYVSPDGAVSEEVRGNATLCWFVPKPFLFCLCCGAVYEKRTKEFTKLARLSSEGRSTATTLLSISAVTQMQQDASLGPESQKILSFTDNRQDASLQAGHFNDFVQVGLLRSAIYRALPDSGALTHATIATEVVKALNLPQAAYAQNPGDIGVQPRRNREALTEYVEYRIYQDLRRGWRVVQPNLEQCGLLKIAYEGLEEVCQGDGHFQANPILASATPETRLKVAAAFLDHLRRTLAMDARCLQGIQHQALIRKVNATLKEPWTFDDDEKLDEGRWFAYGDLAPGDFSLSPISVLGKYLRSSRAWPGLAAPLSASEYERALRALVEVLDRGGYLSREVNDTGFRVQLRVDTLQWVKGDGTPPEPDVRLLRPLTGGEQDTCGVYLPLEGQCIEPTDFPPLTVEDIGDFESARLLRDAARLLLRHGAGPFRSLGHLSFRPRPYQFVPLLMALRLNPVRMLIADDVGIGKTIEAAMIARELLDRGEVRRLAVVCPPYLCDQWQKELKEKFNLDARVVRANTFARLERDLPRQNLSVFEYYPHLVVSVDFVKSQRRRDAFLLHCPDLVIVDEAHGCARPAGQSVAQQQRHEFIHDLAKDESRHLVLLTATPHSGIEESFLSLLGFIRPGFERLSLQDLEQAQRAELARHFIQRRRADVRQWMGAETFFPERDPLEVSFALSPEYDRLFKDIYRFARELVTSGDTQAGVRQRVRYWTALALLRCVMSSPAAAQAALMARLERLAEGGMEEAADYSAYIFDQTEAEASVDVVPQHVVAEGESSFSENERRRLREFSRRAEALRGSGDTKIRKAEGEVRRLLRKGYKPIVFCRFIPTCDYVAGELQQRLKPEFPHLHVLSVTGALSEEERELRVAELCQSPSRVLVATDCLSEGINLQEGFNAVIHYDLPWNPNRLEQREGRVDRFGQTARKVEAILLYGADNPIDGAVLDVLLRKARRIHHSLGITVPLPLDSESVMETVLKALFLRREDTPQLSLFDQEAPVVEVHRQWDHAAEREKRSRTLFAQHAIRPDEVAKELEATDAVLGNPQIVEQFVRAACQRLEVPLSNRNSRWVMDTARLPPILQSKLAGQNFSKLTFDQPVTEGVACVSRNHPLTSALAEYLFEIALNPNGSRHVAARCGVIRSRDVETLTTLLLLRLRFLVEDQEHNLPSVAEECVIAGFKGAVGSEQWLSPEEAESLFEQAKLSDSLSDGDRKHWASTILRNFGALKGKIESLAEDRAKALLESHQRLRRAIRGGRVSVRSLLPVDVLALSVLVPQPKS